MSERQIKEYYERIEKLLNGANKETYGFAPQEIKNILRSYEELQNQNQELKKQLEERDKWLIVCISELMEEYKKDTIWITNQQIESTKNKNISYELYGGNDIKFYQNIKKL